MKKSVKSSVLSSLTVIALITACQPVTQNNVTIPADLNISANTVETRTTVKGKSEFPSPSQNSSFFTKATLQDIASGATVSLIYPSDHPTKANTTIATGLTNATGQFTINPDASFRPQIGEVFVLEASKRLGGAGNYPITIRTHVQWNGSSWDSITTPDIFINTKTTALSIISSLNPSTLPASGTIKKMEVLNGISQVSDINSTFTANLINTIRESVEQALTVNVDPVATISLNNNQYLFQGSPINVIYVNANAIGGNNGINWANAYTSLQDALSVATSGKDIWVATGTYKPTTGTDSTATFQLKEGVKIYGGFTGTETELSQRNFNTNVVILSGDLNNSNSSNFGDSYHVVKGANNATLDGVTIKFGCANNGTSPDFKGGGIYNYYSSPTLTNVTLSNNSAYYGGGIYNDKYSSPTITNVTFNSNDSINYGGGMYNYTDSSPTLTNVTFSNNSANYGGGMYSYTNSSPTLTDVTFISNFATSYGGAMLNANSSPTLTDVTFTSNSASDSGGAMLNMTNSSPTLTNVTFSSNYASDSGGGIYNSYSSPILTNITFTSNSASNIGGAMLNSYSSPVITDVTFTSNSATSYGGGIYNAESSPTLTNVTFSNNNLVNPGNGGGMYNYESSPIFTNVAFNSNSAGWGGGMYNELNSSPILTDVTFTYNSASNTGGGMANSNSSSPTLTNVTFSNNSAKNGGGIKNYKSSPTLTNVAFNSNSAISGYGGGIYNEESSPILKNVIFSNNSATYSGGGMYNYFDNSYPILVNVTFFGNSANKGGGMFIGSYSIVKNTIFWGNTSPDGNNINNSGILYIGYSDVEGGFSGITGGGPIRNITSDMDATTVITDNVTYTAAGNISSDPLFLNTLDLDGSDNILMTPDDGLSLQLGSPARNTGTTGDWNSPYPTDIAGVTRPRGSGVDMGAYEYVE